MEILIAIILGSVQGLTEFLPVSSSGHLVLLHSVFQLENLDNLSFDVALHLGTLVALFFFFYKDIIKYLKAFLKSLRKWELKSNLEQRISWFILVSMIPAAIIGYFFEDIIENVFRSVWLVAIVLIFVSFLFILAEKYSKQNNELPSLTWQKSLLIGVAQAVALIPGVSRSGITIVAGMGFNLKRELAARFSFLISIPIVAAAGAKKMLDLSSLGLNYDELWLYFIGFLTSAVIGYFCIKYFLAFLKRYSLNWFAGYRIILGVVILIWISIYGI